MWGKDFEGFMGRNVKFIMIVVGRVLCVCRSSLVLHVRGSRYRCHWCHYVVIVFIILVVGRHHRCYGLCNFLPPYLPSLYYHETRHNILHQFRKFRSSSSSFPPPPSLSPISYGSMVAFTAIDKLNAMSVNAFLVLP